MNLLDLFENTNQPQGVAEGRADSANPLQRTIDFAVKNGYQVKTSPKRTRATFINRDIDHEIRATLYRVPGDDMIWVNFDDRTSGMSGNDPADAFYDTFVRAYQDAAQDVSAGHADQQRKIFKDNGQPVGEVGIDRESSPGVGQYYMKHYASGTDNSGYDSFEEAVEELRHLVMQGVSEAMKPSDIPPSMRDRLTMRDIEREQPQGAFRFRVTFPDGATADFMDFEAAQQSAAVGKGRISKINTQTAESFQKKRHDLNDPLAGDGQRKLAEENRPSARIDRILKQLRARHPQAEDDLEALIYDFRTGQSQDRRDINRLDMENDQEEADIDKLEQMINKIQQRRGISKDNDNTVVETSRSFGVRVRRSGSEETVIETKKDACYHKVKSRYKVWPSAYASGALVQCRKKGASNWGKK